MPGRSMQSQGPSVLAIGKWTFLQTGLMSIHHNDHSLAKVSTFWISGVFLRALETQLPTCSGRNLAEWDFV